MAGTSLLALLDDIAAILDDVSVMTQMAAKRTAAVMGDDLAVSAERVSGVRAERELPVVWAVAKGSFRNKLILVPAALGISAVAGWMITPLLMFGGLFLCYEGVEKLTHPFLHSKESDLARRKKLVQELADPSVDPVQLEQGKIRGAIRTDFVLSAEIIVITLGVVSESTFATQVTVLAGIAVAMTIGVYGLVAVIVKLDDLGVHLSQKEGEGAGVAYLHWLGARLLKFAPWLMKALGVVGTAAMLAVGGGILAHGIPVLHAAVEGFAHSAAAIPIAGDFLAALTPTLLGALIGIFAGAGAMVVVHGLSRLREGWRNRRA
jgi:predicted DNA repair protein MutK